jgi:hypothetical protein
MLNRTFPRNVQLRNGRRSVETGDFSDGPRVELIDDLHFLDRICQLSQNLMKVWGQAGGDVSRYSITATIGYRHPPE